MLNVNIELPFRVKACTGFSEQVCVVGNCPELGDWAVKKAKMLSMETKTSDGNSIWSAVIRVPPHKEIEFRYVICHVRETEHEDEDGDIVVRKWETNIKPRKFSLAAHGSQNLLEDVHVFGEYDNKVSIDQGWLTGQTEIRFRIHSNPIHMWKHRYRNQTYRIKCTPIDLRYKDEQSNPSDDECLCQLSLDEDSNHDLPVGCNTNRVLVSVLNGQEDEPAEQPQFGIIYHHDSYVVFRSQFFDMETMGYQFDFYVHDPNAGPSDVCKYVGHAFLLPLDLHDLIGVKQLPIVGLKHRPIGQIKVDYLMIKPLSGFSCDCSVSYARHWKRHRGALDVGHRGLGSSYTNICVEEAESTDQVAVKKCEAVRENTIASLSEAAGHGADFVEFDVQLSKDDVPVIYHDFVVSLSLKKKFSQELEWFDIPVHELNLAQLQMLQVDHVSTKSKGSPSSSKNSDQEDQEDAHPFPTLRECFEKLDPEIGLNIEIKYCMQLKSGEMEDDLKHYKERNKYVDIILREILLYARRRRIVLSSFDPDICSMVRLKQNRYPILYCPLGETSQWPPFNDSRSSSNVLAIQSAHAEHLMGVNLHTEDLMKAGPSLVDLCRHLGLIIFCWGEDNNSRSVIQDMRALGVDGIIYDRIHELKPHKKSVFKMEQEAKLTLLKDRGCIDCSPSLSPTTADQMSHAKLCQCGKASSSGQRSSSPSDISSILTTAVANCSNGSTNGIHPAPKATASDTNLTTRLHRNS